MRALILFSLYFSCITVSVGQIGDIIWQDEFNDGALDQSKWSYETGIGVNGDWGTGQLDRATSRPENVSFLDGVAGADGGCLVITTRKEQYVDRDYTSGRINTKGKGSWGPGHRIVARVMPGDVKYQGQGFAFWMMPAEKPAGYDHIMWPQGGEIDIMEYVGAIPYHNLGTVHYAWSWENNQYQDWNHGHLGAYYSYEHEEVPNPAEPGYGNFPPPLGDINAGSSTFHIYGIDWYIDRIEFFIDDNVYHIHYLNDGDAFQKDGEDEIVVRNTDGRRVGVSEYSNHFSQWHPFEHKMYAILSAGVGGADHTYGGPIIPEAEFPCSVYVDWVRVYEINIPVLGLEDEQPAAIFYPNPTHNQLNIQLSQHQGFEMKIVDMAGKVIISSRFEGPRQVDLSGIESGQYMVIIDDGRKLISKKILKY